MNIDYYSLALFGKFGGAMLGLLLIVWVIALLTPKAARLVDRISGKKGIPERVHDSNDPENEYKVYSVFEDRPRENVNEHSRKNDDDSTK